MHLRVVTQLIFSYFLQKALLFFSHCTMNKAGSNSGHLRKKLNVQKINFFYFFLDLNTIWEGPKAKKPIEIPYKPVYAS